MSLHAAILTALAILGIALLGVWQSAPSVFAEARGLMDGERLDMLVARAGIWGPVVIVTLMTVAVVASPIPSAPIAFSLARILGHDVLRRVFGDRVDAGLLGSQTVLAATVFAGGLMPVVSLDMISYAAGLSRLHA